MKILYSVIEKGIIGNYTGIRIAVLMRVAYCGSGFGRGIPQTKILIAYLQADYLARKMVI